MTDNIYNYVYDHAILNKLSVPVKYQGCLYDSTSSIHTYKSAYVSLTYTCNLHGICGYCYSYDQQSANIMDISNFSTIIKYISLISDCREVSFVGGEPTLINNLPDYFDICNKFGLKAILYTNACCSPNLMKNVLKKQNLEEVSVHFIPDIFYHVRHVSEFDDTFDIINHYPGAKSIIFVIDKKWDTKHFNILFDLATKYHYALRWIFATPTSRLTPSMSLADMQYITHTALQPFLIKCLNNNVQTAPDLTIPLCVFDENFLIEYSEKLNLIKLCSPFIYFKPDLRMQYCTSLNDIVRPAPQSGNDIRDFIIRNRCMCNNIKKIPSFSECVDCLLWENKICQGGCLTYKLFRGTT